MSQQQAYKERLTSNWTEALFIGLTLTFAALAWWQISGGGPDFFIGLFSFLTIFFLFYTLNYRTLLVSIDQQGLRLKFGVFSYTIPFDNIESFSLDQIPWLVKYGGAGIHFMSVRGRYRASFNFLEYPRVVIGLRKKSGLVRDVSFSTRRPDEILGLLQQMLVAKEG